MTRLPDSFWETAERRIGADFDLTEARMLYEGGLLHAELVSGLWLLYEVADREMLIWVALAISGKVSSFQDSEEAIVALAKRCGCARIAFRTKRLGFGRKLSAAWSEPIIWWTREVT